MTGEQRTDHYDELEPILNQAMKTKTSEEWLKELTEVGIPCGPINTIDKVADHPQVQHREMIVDVPHPRLGRVKMVNSPVKLSRTPATIRQSAPDLGQDTGEILSELLGMSRDEIDELKESEII